MPKKSTPDSDLKAEFAELRKIAREEKAAAKALDAIKVRKRKTVHALHHKQGANIGSMAEIFGVSRQALTKEIRVIEVAKGASKATSAAKAPAVKKAPAKAAASAKRAPSASASIKPPPAKRARKSA